MLSKSEDESESGQEFSELRDLIGLDEAIEAMTEARLAHLLAEHFDELANPAERPVVLKRILTEVQQIARQPVKALGDGKEQK